MVHAADRAGRVNRIQPVALLDTDETARVVGVGGRHVARRELARRDRPQIPAHETADPVPIAGDRRRTRSHAAGQDRRVVLAHQPADPRRAADRAGRRAAADRAGIGVADQTAAIIPPLDRPRRRGSGHRTVGVPDQPAGMIARASDGTARGGARDRAVGPTDQPARLGHAGHRTGRAGAADRSARVTDQPADLGAAGHRPRRRGSGHRTVGVPDQPAGMIARASDGTARGGARDRAVGPTDQPARLGHAGHRTGRAGAADRSARVTDQPADLGAAGHRHRSAGTRDRVAAAGIELPDQPADEIPARRAGHRPADSNIRQVRVAHRAEQPQRTCRLADSKVAESETVAVEAGAREIRREQTAHRAHVDAGGKLPRQPGGLREALEIDQALHGPDAVKAISVRGEAIGRQAQAKAVADPVRVLRAADGTDRPVMTAVDRDRRLVVVRVRHRAADVQIPQQPARVARPGHAARGIAVGQRRARLHLADQSADPVVARHRSRRVRSGHGVLVEPDKPAHLVAAAGHAASGVSSRYRSDIVTD